VSAEVIRLSDYRAGEAAEIDLVTAVDAAIRDLREILSCWGTATARQRAEECETMLQLAFAASALRHSGNR
jgi:hypothetical protein